MLYGFSVKGTERHSPRLYIDSARCKSSVHIHTYIIDDSMHIYN